jgi:phosphatidylinositol glycan class V
LKLIVRLQLKKFGAHIPRVLISLSTLTRSNGLLTIGFVMYIILVTDTCSWYRLSNRRSHTELVCKLFANVMFATICLLLVLIPYALYLYLIQSHFCTTNVHELPLRVRQLSNVQLPDPSLEICRQSFLQIYSILQRKHWNVFLFGYYSLRKVPNFMLALPVLTNVYMLSKEYFQKINNFKIEFSRRFTLLPFVVHSIFMSALGMFVINVEVSTRLLFASNPILYFSAAQIRVFSTRKLDAKNMCSLNLFQLYVMLWSNASNFLSKSMIVYYVGYTFIGTLLHVNWLPWTWAMKIKWKFE